MDFINLLAGISVYGDGFGSIQLNWIGRVIQWIISLVGDVGFGIILFTAVLKLITLAPDIWSRVSMKKNSLKMELMKEDLEKLQKQYANDPKLYQQKMMALYKKNGYSAFSACLPSIITIVVFIIVINAFSAYSNSMNFEVYNGMGKAYTAVVVEEAENTGYLVKESEEGNIYVINQEKYFTESGKAEYFDYSEEKGYTLKKDKYGAFKEAYPALADYFDEENKLNTKNAELLSTIDKDFRQILIQKIGKETLKADGFLNEAEDDIINVAGVMEKYKDNPDVGKFYNADNPENPINYEEVLKEGDLSGKFEINAENLVNEKAKNAVESEKINEIREKARNAARESYINTRINKSYITPWIKNIWITDSPFSTAIPESFAKLKSSLRSNTGSLTEEDYNEITANLADYKKTGFKNGNGWFILIALSILTMLGTQLIMQKSQKAQMQLSTVDGGGQAAMTSKMMTWMMPIMFGIFAFLYSASFSLYMIVSSLLSMLTTFLINFFVEKSFKGKIEKEMREKASKPGYGKKR